MKSFGEDVVQQYSIRDSLEIPSKSLDLLFFWVTQNEMVNGFAVICHLLQQVERRLAGFMEGKGDVELGLRAGRTSGCNGFFRGFGENCILVDSVDMLKTEANDLSQFVMR